uniref:C2H2-type domain-containing protein n=1 Tax=Strigamia maritima TaxID=126957 RepID=T1JLZ6_STRMM
MEVEQEQINSGVIVKTEVNSAIASSELIENAAILPSNPSELIENNAAIVSLKSEFIENAIIVPWESFKNEVIEPSEVEETANRKKRKRTRSVNIKKELSVSIVDNDSPRSKINIVWFVCSAENCDYKSYRKFNIDRHFRKMHDQPTKPGRCCDLDFLSKFEYFQHVKTHHANGYYCYVDGCSAWFRKKSTLDRHSIVHTGIKNVHCDSCEYKTPHAYNMRRHCLTRNHQCSNDKVHLSKSLDQIDVHVDSDVDGKII